MKPVSLYIEGFRSHRDPIELDFTGRKLIAIVGPTGSGKSSILDAISFALYGKTPRTAHTNKLICSRSPRARVRLRFAVDERVCEVSRSIPAASDDYLLDIASDEKTLGARAIGSKIEEILGLDFEAFGSSVLLAQNQFSAFLDATKTERTKILKGVFRIEQIDELRKAAVGRRNDLTLQLENIAGQRVHIPEDAPQLVKQAKVQLKGLVDRATVLEEALPEEASLEARIEELIAEGVEALKQMGVLENLARRLPDGDELDEIAREEASLVVALKDASAVAARCQKDLDGARKKAAELERKLGTHPDLVRLEEKAKRLATSDRRIETRAAGLATAKESAVRLDESLAAAAEAELAAEAGLERAREALRLAQDEHRAHALRAGLAPGDPCPVCEQVVARVPPTKKPAGRNVLEKAETSASKSSVKARAAKAKAAEELAAARSELAAHQKEIDAERLEAGDARKELAKFLGAVTDPAAEIEKRLSQVEASGSLLTEAQRSLDEARAELERRQGSMGSLEKRRRTIAAGLIELAGRLVIAAPAIDSESEQLQRAAASARTALGERSDDFAEQIDKAERAVGEARGSRAAILEKLGIESGTISAALQKVHSEIGARRKTIEDLEAKIRLAKELDASARTFTARKRLFEQLADDLRNETFIHFLLEDRRRLLAELASERLRAMTGRYRFDPDFNIVDEYDGDRVRDVDTLSGGETFLGSLALALGLAESAARHGGRLQSFFLDEGFGSLDSESFDLALDGIERIVAPDRLIGLVSHVAALAARVDDQIVLEKDPDGMSIVVSGAA